MPCYVYLLTNAVNTTIYIGVTNNLPRRVWEHREKTADGFTKRYHLSKLVYCEVHQNAYAAISREKQLKGWTRARKNELVERRNPSPRPRLPRGKRTGGQILRVRGTLRNWGAWVRPQNDGDGGRRKTAEPLGKSVV